MNSGVLGGIRKVAKPSSVLMRGWEVTKVILCNLQASLTVYFVDSGSWEATHAWYSGPTIRWLATTGVSLKLILIDLNRPSSRPIESNFRSSLTMYTF